MGKQIVYYTSKDGCKPCEEITKLVEEGKFHNTETDEVDLVDIGTDEGFERFQKEVLAKNPGGVPSAYMDGIKCQITVVDGDLVQFECVKSAPPAGLEETPTPASVDT